MRKFTYLMICILLVMAMSVTAFAGEVDGSETPPPESHTHTWDGGTVTTPATCTAGGVMTYSCGCGETRTEPIAATGVHTYGSWQNVDSSTHKRVCSGCGAEESGAHSWDGGTVTTAATCTAEGVKTYSCGCGATKTETLPVAAAAHTYGEWTRSEGSHSRTCTGCGQSQSGSHDLAVSATYPATCKEEGATAYGCVVCGGIWYEILPKLTTHTYDNVCDPDCNVCGATRNAEHKYSTAWSRNSREHWHVCTACGSKKDVADHYPGPAATEEKDQICLTCGLVMTPKLNHTHKYETEWTSDETGHWYACSGCEMQKDFEEHSYDDPCDPDCNICDYTTASAHSYDGTWTSDETGHWAVCTLCGEESEIEEHISGPEATETEAQLCAVCSFEIAPAKEEHEHEFGESWVTDEASHWKECECGEKAEEDLHTWDDGTENKDSTVTFTCTVCQAEQIEEAPENDGGLWWLVVLLVILILACAGAVVAIVVLLRSGKASGKFTD